MIQKINYYLRAYKDAEKSRKKILRISLQKMFTFLDQWRFYRITRNSRKKLSVSKTYTGLDNLSGGQKISFETFLEILRGSNNLDTQTLLEKGEEILQHRFDVLGSRQRWLYIGEELSKVPRPVFIESYANIPWTMDIKTRHIYDPLKWAKIIGPASPSDMKVPWQLSRAQHMRLLGLCYRATTDRKYLNEFKNQIIDWVHGNPYCRGPNWKCTMEVGIRVANWLTAMLYFLESDELGNEFYSWFLDQVYLHGIFMTKHFEKTGDFASNHYVGNIAGLYFIGVLCPMFKESQEWRIFAKKELENEIQQQTFGDSLNFESSTCYHRLVLEMFLYCFLLGQAVDDTYSTDYKDTLLKKIAAIGNMAKPNGNIPQIGDNDSGRFIISNYSHDLDSLNVNYLKYYGMKCFKNEYQNRVTEQSTTFRDSGRYIFKNDSIYLIVSAGPKGQGGRGGHAHNDVLSFELNVRGKDIFVDPGTYCYTSYPEERNRFRSIASHNTLYWPGIEPCDLSVLFLLKEEGVLEILDARVEKDNDFFHGRYSYGGRWHEREILLDKRRNVIFFNDSCSSEGALISFICAPDCNPVLINNEIDFGEGKMIFYDNCQPILTTTKYSKAYGHICDVTKIEIPVQNKKASFQIVVNAS